MRWIPLGCIFFWISVAAHAAMDAPSLPALPAFTKSDRILVLAPHEDDECLGAGGVIQRAQSLGATVHVIYLTQGDHNEWAFLMYRKSPVLTPEINRQMGENRRAEALQAMHELGLPRENVTFLGFPDNGTLKIWENHWGDATAFHSLLTNTVSVPYADTIGQGQLYKGESILQALESQLIAYKPTHIFVTHPIDSNPDHRALFLYLQVALLDLQGKLATPTVYCYPIHMGPWPRPMNYHPDEWQDVPQLFHDIPFPWWTLTLTSAETQRKADAIRLNKSQMADHGYWLVSFAKQNELFTTLPITDLSQHLNPGQKAVAEPGTGAYDLGISTGHIDSVRYRAQSDGLAVDIEFRNRLESDAGISIFTFGYRHDVPFAVMPKLHLHWEFGRARLMEQGQRRPAVDVVIQRRPGGVSFLIPWDLLRNPQAVFVQVRALAGGLPVSQTGWRILEVSKHS